MRNHSVAFSYIQQQKLPLPSTNHLEESFILSTFDSRINLDEFLAKQFLGNWIVFKESYGLLDATWETVIPIVGTIRERFIGLKTLANPKISTTQ